MPELNRQAVEAYLCSLLGKRVRVLEMTALSQTSRGDLKAYGYGTPVRIEYRAEGEAGESAVLHTMGSNGFGHEHASDRARVLLWQYAAFNRLPRHIRSLDVGAFQFDGSLISLGRSEEFCLLTEYADGAPYAADLERLSGEPAMTDQDQARADGAPSAY